MDPVPPKEYAEILRELILDPKRRMILSANAIWEQLYGEKTDRAVFETSSNRFHRQFITLWELFDERAEFQRCVFQLAAAARVIREQKRFSTVVTSTAVARYLAVGIHAELERNEDPITLRTLIVHSGSTGHHGLPSFRGEEVLVLADIVDTGKTTEHLVKAIRSLDGVPVAALSVAIVGEQLIAAATHAGAIIEKVRLDALTTLQLDEPGPASFDVDKSIRLDPETLLPLETAPLPVVPAAIPLSAMYQQFESAEAIGFGLFKTASSLVTTAIRLPRLFEHHGDTIWQSISHYFEYSPPLETEKDAPTEPPAILVTTFERGDVIFKEFVEQRLRRDGWPGWAKNKEVSSVFFGLRSDGDYIILPHRIAEIDDKEIVLLLSSAQSATKVRAMSALLAAHNAKTIRIVCLANRMGRQTAYFISRISKLLSGLGNSNPVAFSFYPVYNIAEFESARLRSSLNMIGSLFDHFSTATRVPSFLRWLKQVRSYFEPIEMSGVEFAEGRNTPIKAVLLPLPGEPNQAVRVGISQTKMSVITGLAAYDRKYDHLLKELQSATDRQTIYLLIVVLLADLGFLRKTSRFKQLLTILEKRLNDLRKQRFDLEHKVQSADDVASRNIDRIVDTETYILFGWALVAFLDHTHDYGTLAVDILLCRRDFPGDWMEYPENFSRYFLEERVAWTLAFLLHTTHPDLRRSNRSDALKDKLRSYAQTLIELIPDIYARRLHPPRGDQLKSEQSLLRGNLEYILNEIGTHDNRIPVEIVRYLHSMLFKSKQHHSPISTILDQLIESLESLLPTGPQVRGARRTRIESSAVVTRMDNAISIIGQLEEIARDAAKLFDFTPTTRTLSQRFTNRPPEKGLQFDVKVLGDYIERIRKDRRVSWDDVQELAKRNTAIQEDLWGEGSVLRGALLRYVTPLEQCIQSALDLARKQFRNKEYKDVWKEYLNEYEEVNSEPYVLLEASLLTEVLKNILTNVRHNFKDYKKKKGTPFHALVELSTKIIPGGVSNYAADNLERVQIVLKSFGNPYTQTEGREHKTFTQHQAIVARFGGELTIESYKTKSHGKSHAPMLEGTKVTLTLISRNQIAKNTPNTKKVLT